MKKNEPERCPYCGGIPEPTPELSLFLLACEDILRNPDISHVENVIKAHKHASNKIKNERKKD